MNADNLGDVAKLSVKQLQNQLKNAKIEVKSDFIVNGNGTISYIDSNGATVQIHYENGKATAIRIKTASDQKTYYKMENNKPVQISRDTFMTLKESSDNARKKASNELLDPTDNNGTNGTNGTGDSDPIAKPEPKQEPAEQKSSRTDSREPSPNVETPKKPSWLQRQYRRLFNKPETSVVDTKTGRQTDTYTNRKGQVTREVVTDTNHNRPVSETEYNNNKPVIKTEYTYHMNGTPDKTIVTEYSNGKPHTQIEYTNGLETKVSRYRNNGELNQTTQNIYDANNDLQTRITSDYYKNKVTTVKKESNFKDVNGEPKATVEIAERNGKKYSKTEYEYSDEGKILKTVEETVPNAEGFSTRTTKTSNGTTKEILQTFGDKQLVVSKTTERSAGLNNKSTETATYYRNTDGTLEFVEIIRSKEKIIQNQFDNLERPLHEEFYNGEGTKTGSKTYKYNGETRTEITTDQYNRVDTQVYQNNKLISRKMGDKNTGVTNFEMFKQGNRTIEVQNIYDSRMVISEREVTVTDADGRTHTYKWEYDSNGENPTPKIKEGQNYREPRSTETVYDETGREYVVGDIGVGDKMIVTYTIKENGRVIGTRTETTASDGTWKTEDVFFDNPVEGSNATPASGNSQVTLSPRINQIFSSSTHQALQGLPRDGIVILKKGDMAYIAQNLDGEIKIVGEINQNELCRVVGNNGKELPDNYILNSISVRQALNNAIENGTFIKNPRSYRDLIETAHKLAYHGPEGNIYYYMKDGKLLEMNAGELKSDGIWSSSYIEEGREIAAIAEKYNDPYYQTYHNDDLNAINLPGVKGRPHNNGAQHIYPDNRYADQYFKMMHQTAKEAMELINRGAPQDQILAKIAEHYQYAVNFRPFEQINNSLFMTEINTMLKKAGMAPIPHGKLDFAAQRLQPETFKKYFIDQYNQTAIKTSNNNFVPSSSGGHHTQIIRPNEKPISNTNNAGIKNSNLPQGDNVLPLQTPYEVVDYSQKPIGTQLLKEEPVLLGDNTVLQIGTDARNIIDLYSDKYWSAIQQLKDGESLIIGRDPVIHIENGEVSSIIPNEVPDITYVSRQHLKVTRAGNEFYVEDISSTKNVTKIASKSENMYAVAEDDIVLNEDAKPREIEQQNFEEEEY